MICFIQEIIQFHFMYRVVKHVILGQDLRLDLIGSSATIAMVPGIHLHGLMKFQLEIFVPQGGISLEDLIARETR